MKRVLFLIGGIFWMLFAFGFIALLIQYVAGGAGLQFFGWAMSSDSILVGLVHVTGFCVAAVLCLAIGAGLWAHGMVRDHAKEKPNENR